MEDLRSFLKKTEKRKSRVKSRLFLFMLIPNSIS